MRGERRVSLSVPIQCRAINLTLLVLKLTAHLKLINSIVLHIVVAAVQSSLMSGLVSTRLGGTIQTFSSEGFYPPVSWYCLTASLPHIHLTTTRTCNHCQADHGPTQIKFTELEASTPPSSPPPSTTSVVTTKHKPTSTVL